MTMLNVQHLQKRYGQYLAVRDVSFQIAAGEIYGLLGPNGAGKSTTIKVLSCLVRPDGGTVLIDGFDVLRDTSRVKQRIGIVPQDLALYDDLSALENLMFFGQLYGLAGKPLKTRAMELLGDVGLLDRAHHRVGGFSGGMKRRMNIAAGLIHGPKLLYLDEPTVGIDPQSRRLILDLVKNLNQRGLAVLYTTHYMEEAEELCHTIGIIDHGKIIAEGTLAQMRQRAGELTPIHINLRHEPLPHHIAELKTLAETVDTEGETLTILSTNPRQTLPKALMVLADLDVHHVEIEEPNLESVFLRLTGRSLRD
jgi:ABC-2 type transport system ATP-binding protein